MKKAHPGMKRNVRFDDEALDLVLDVKLSDGHPWKRIRPSQAQAARVSLPSDSGSTAVEIDSDEVKSLLGSSGHVTGANSCPLGGSK